MWTRRDCANALLAAVLFTVVGLLLFPPASRPATYRAGTALVPTGTDVLKVAWYLKGEGDLALPSLGYKVARLTCEPAGAKVACQLKTVTLDFSKQTCAHGLFAIDGFGVKGQFSRPKPCGGPAA